MHHHNATAEKYEHRLVLVSYTIRDLIQFFSCLYDMIPKGTSPNKVESRLCVEKVEKVDYGSTWNCVGVEEREK